MRRTSFKARRAACGASVATAVVCCITADCSVRRLRFQANADSMGFWIVLDRSPRQYCSRRAHERRARRHL
jgi:hypothetical protein